MDAHTLILKVADAVAAQQAILNDLLQDLRDYQTFLTEELERMKEEPTEQYLCKSYFKDGKILDCTCGKCKVTV